MDLRGAFLLLLSQLSILKAHEYEHAQGGRQQGNRSSNGSLAGIPKETQFLLSLRCTSDVECSFNDTGHTNANITVSCDKFAGFCTCPSEIQGIRVVPHPKTNEGCVFSIPIGGICRNNLECSLNTTGAICLNSTNDSTELRCTCIEDSCDKNADPYSGSYELWTLKWIFLFILVGYPVLTLAFAIFENGTEAWFVKKLLLLLEIGKRKSQKKSRRNRRNTDEDLVSSDEYGEEDRLCKNGSHLIVQCS